MNTKSLPYLLALLACSDGTQRSAGVATPAELRTELVAPRRQSLMMVNVGWTNHSDTVAWTDTTRRGDTSFAARGRVVTTTTVLVDSQWVQLPPQPSIIPGVPVGLFGIWDGTRLKPNTEVLSLSTGAEAPGTIVRRLEEARLRGVRMVTSMTGGRARYLTDGVFDMAKWKARMDAYDKPEIRDAVTRAVNEGILIANSVMDEPYNTGEFAGQEKNGWGPRGTMYKARVDSMCGYAKEIFPTLPQGVFQDYTDEEEGSYRVCDFITTQYRTSKGSLTKYRDGALEICRRDRHACSFSINVLDGGIQAERRRPDGTRKTDYDPTDCPLTTTGGKGTYFPNCRMTPAQVREVGRVLGPASCFLTGWRYDSAFMAIPENQQAYRDIAAELAARSAPRCTRS